MVCVLATQGVAIFKQKWDALFSLRGKCENETTKRLLDKFGFTPNFKIVNVVGTNGKGSTSNYLYQGLRTKYSVGLFTSPHLIEPNERIIFNDKQITNEEFFEIYDGIKDVLLENDYNFFPTMFIVAMLWFQKQEIDYVVLEAGIGARFDPTTIYDGVVGVVTSLAKDHMNWFGETLADVATDKAGFMNKGMDVYMPTNLDEKNIFESEARLFDIKIKYNELTGNYNQRNVQLANSVLSGTFGIDKHDFQRPLGRSQQVYSPNGTVAYIDVAHNLDGIKKSLELLSQEGAVFDDVVISLASRKDKTEIKELFKNKKVYGYQIDDSFYSATEMGVIELNSIISHWKETKQRTLYIGSFHLAGKLLNEKG